MSAITTFHKDLIVVDQSKLDGMSQGDLVELAKDINGKAIKAAKQTLIHAGQTGIVLIALKEKVPHGQFLKFVESLTEIPARTAQTYMSIAINYATVAHLRGVRDAIRYIRESSGRANRIIESAPVTLPPAPRPASSVIMDAEIMEPSKPVTIEAHAEVIELEPAPESIDDQHEAQVEEPATIGKSARLVELEAVIEKGSADAFETIVELLPFLSKDQLGELRKIITTRWLP